MENRTGHQPQKLCENTCIIPYPMKYCLLGVHFYEPICSQPLWTLTWFPTTVSVVASWKGRPCPLLYPDIWLWVKTLVPPKNWVFIHVHPHYESIGIDPSPLLVQFPSFIWIFGKPLVSWYCFNDVTGKYLDKHAIYPLVIKSGNVFFRVKPPV